MEWLSKKIQKCAIQFGIALLVFFISLRFVIKYLILGVSLTGYILFGIILLIVLFVTIVIGHSLKELLSKQKIYKEIPNTFSKTDMVNYGSLNDIRLSCNKQREKEKPIFYDSRIILTTDYLYSIEDNRAFVIDGILDLVRLTVKTKQEFSPDSSARLSSVNLIFLYYDGKCYSITYTPGQSDERNERMQNDTQSVSSYIVLKSKYFRKYESYRLPKNIQQYVDK